MIRRKWTPRPLPALQYQMGCLGPGRRRRHSSQPTNGSKGSYLVPIPELWIRMRPFSTWRMAASLVDYGLTDSRPRIRISERSEPGIRSREEHFPDLRPLQFIAGRQRPGGEGDGDFF